MSTSEMEAQFLANIKIILEQSRDVSLSDDLKPEDLISEVFDDSLELYEVAIALEDDFDFQIDFSSLDSEKGKKATLKDLYQCA